MTKIAAFDLSLSRTGVALYGHTAGVPIWVGCIIPGPEIRGAARLVHIRDLVVSAAGGSDVVVLEGYAYGRPNAAAASGELGGVVRVAFHEAGITTGIIPPASVKKYATGRGNASKEQVLGAAVHRAGRMFDTTDEADAWWLLQMALAGYDLPHVTVPADHRSALEKIHLPDPNGVIP